MAAIKTSWIAAVHLSVKGVEQALEYPMKQKPALWLRSSLRARQKQPPAAAKDAAKAVTSTSVSNLIGDRTQIDARAQEEARQMITENELIAYYLQTGKIYHPRAKEQVENSKKS